jgi:hypothetical protein
MKVTLNKSALILHGKRLKLRRPTKSVAAQARVEVSVSQEVTIMVPSFSEKVNP